MIKPMMGNHALSYGALLSRAQVISAYPITPQTQVVELLSEMVADGSLNAKFIKVESEHSAMAACIGAAATGARTFTATSAQGLALMHEMLHWAVGARLPIVLGNINRAMGPPWTVWTEQTDSLSQRDTGWMQIYAADNQEVLDSVILAYKVSEKVLLPSMIVLDAFFLSHTSEPVDVPDQEKVDEFLPPYNPELKLDVNDPHAFGGLTGPGGYMELRYLIQKAHEDALIEIEKAGDEFHKIFGREYKLVETYRTEDAEIIFVALSTVAQTARIAVDSLRKKGIKAGVLRIRVFRPFPSETIRNILNNVEKIIVYDRNLSPGRGGIVYHELSAALHHGRLETPVWGIVGGLGGRDVTPKDIEEMFLMVLKEEKPEREIIWKGLKK